MKSKISIFLFLIIFTLFGCNKDGSDPNFNLLGYWNLTAKQTPQNLIYIQSKKLDFSERYIFNEDGTFIKLKRNLDSEGNEVGIPKQALGRYEMVPAEEQGILYEVVLTFETNTELACTCHDHELLWVMTSKELVNFSGMPCDKEGLIYSKR